MIIYEDEKRIDARLGKPYIKAVILSDDTTIFNMQCELNAKLDIEKLKKIDKENTLKRLSISVLTASCYI